MDYEPKDDPMGADDKGGIDFDKITALVSSLQSQLDELKSLMPGAMDAAPTDDGVAADDAAQSIDEDKADAATPDGSSMPKELLMKAMRGI